MDRGGADRWVFGYGSLMWRPGFSYIERRTAVLHGRRRAFCIYSVHHRGTYERPGLVLGLAPGGSVRGAAYRVSGDDWPEVYAYLREREQPTETYFEAWREVKIDGDAIGGAPHGTPRRQPKDQTWPFVRSTMMDRVDAEGPTTPMEQRRATFYEAEPRPPHQRAVAEHPAIARVLHR